MKPDHSAHTSIIPRLYDAYVAAMANAFRPDRTTAIVKLRSIAYLASEAAAIIEGAGAGKAAVISDVMTQGRRAQLVNELVEEAKQFEKVKR